MNGKIPLKYNLKDGRSCFYDESYLNKTPPVWSNTIIEDYLKDLTPDNIINNKLVKEYGYGNHLLKLFIQAIEKYNIKNKNVAVIGSIMPWLETILLNFNNKVTTIEYNVPICNYPNLYCKSYDNFKTTSNIYDCIVTYSSIEHAGLGRYGDILNPDADIETMQEIYNNLKTNGILIWGAPMGKDILFWNSHRHYGKIRLPLLFKNFEELEWVGDNKENLFKLPLYEAREPIVVLKKI